MTIPTTTKLPVSDCPEWCDGRADRHARWAEECVGDVSCHERSIAEISLPAMKHPERGSFRSVTVRISGDDEYGPIFVSLFALSGAELTLTTSEARSLAAMLTRAADVAELGL